MKKIFGFGEEVKGYDVKVLNENEVRAGAGILFVFSFIGFMNSFLLGNFLYTKIFVILFVIDFFIRVFVNPKFSPSLILARIIVSNQKPEYVGASQKRFAWGLGFLLGITMFYLLVINYIIGPWNLLICLICLLLLGFESFFGICLGCKMYNLFNKNKAELCPGGVCENKQKDEIQKISFAQVFILILFFILIFFVGKTILNNTKSDLQNNIGIENLDKGENKNCIAPDWAKAIGHEEKWKLHHGCE